MKRLILSGLLSLTLAPTVMTAQPAETYVNEGVLTTPPVIDAVNFINLGSFGSPQLPLIFNQVIPYDTFDTLNYTNFGFMYGELVGWRFAYTPNSSAPRGMAANFVNFNPGVIQAFDVANGAGGIFQNCVVAPVYPSMLFIFATNIITGAGIPTTGASLIVGANGDMRLEGVNVDLSYSGLEVTPVWVEPLGSPTDNTNFIPDLGIYDLYWAQATFNMNNPLLSGTLWNGFTARAQGVPSPPTQPQGTAAPQFLIPGAAADSYIQFEFASVTLTNFTGPATNVTTMFTTDVFYLSNIVKGAVFVGVPPGMSVQMGFSGSPQFGNDAQTINVSLATTLFNIVTGQSEPAFIDFQDTLASDTRVRGNAINLVGCGAATARPAPYQIDRGLLGVGASGNNGFPDPNFFTTSGNIQFNPTDVIVDVVTNATLTSGEFAAYGAVLDSLVSRLPAVPGAAITNLPGRIRILADNLDLTQARLRGESSIVINTPNLISTSNAIVEVETYSLNLGSTNGLLKIQNLVPDVVQRMRGDILAWSANWTNQVRITFTNNYTFTNIVTTNMVGTNAISITNIMAIFSPVTNSLAVHYHTLMLDASSVSTVLPISVYDLITHSEDVVINDNIRVIQSLLIDGLSLTLNGQFTIPGFYPPDPLTGLVPPIPPLMNWAGVNAPNIQDFTNNGTLLIANQGHFGDDRPLYANFVNAGTISAASIAINSFYFENPGSLASIGPIIMQGNMGRLENGSSVASTTTRLLASDLKFNNYSLSSTNGGLFISVTNSLSDAGPGSGNVFQVLDGFNLLIKPLSGDLLGTTINDIAATSPSIRIDHQWAGEDRGPSPSGFLNDAAIGTVALISQSLNPLFVFRGTGAHNGMYVDLLDLSGLSTAFQNEIQINPNLVIYFAATKLPAGVVLPPNTSAEEYLDGKFGGHLRWVQGYAGANSSQFAVVNGQSILVNKALFNSMLIDSDNDGTVNGIDVDPGGVFQGGGLTVDVVGNGTVAPDLNGQLLIVGQTYSVTAVPADGWTFTEWTGSTNTASRTLTFTMEDGLNFVANFAYAPKSGTYNGLFMESGGVQLGSSGAITLTVTASGKVSGVVQIGTTRSSFTGQLDSDGNLSKFIPRKNGSGLTLEVQVGGKHLTGTITDGTFTADVTADLAPFDGITRVAPFTGSYTVSFGGSGNPSDTTLPLGHGYGTLTVNAAGRLQFKGVEADGTKVSQGTSVSGDGTWALYAPFTKESKGQVLGWMSFINNGVDDVSGLVNWIKLANATAKLYPDGFNFSTNASGSKYNASKKPVTGFNHGTVRLTGANLATDITGGIAIASNNKVTSAGGSKMTVTLNPTDGTLKGSVINPTTGKKINYNGVILQKHNNAAGFFPGGGLSGEMTLEP